MHASCGSRDPIGFWDPAGFAADGNKENFARRRQTELKHGRIAMLATMGRLALPWPDWFLLFCLSILGQSLLSCPCRSQRRQPETKLAVIREVKSFQGYITPEITGKLPGFLSPSAGLKFADVPNGLAAISKAHTSSNNMPYAVQPQGTAVH